MRLALCSTPSGKKPANKMWRVTQLWRRRKRHLMRPGQKQAWKFRRKASMSQASSLIRYPLRIFLSSCLGISSRGLRTACKCWTADGNAERGGGGARHCQPRDPGDSLCLELQSFMQEPEQVCKRAAGSPHTSHPFLMCWVLARALATRC